MFRNIVIIFLFSCCFSCEVNEQNSVNHKQTNYNKSFTEISADYSGIHFNNKIDAKDLKSPLQFVNVYNGGGVAIGDINNDGLADIFLTGNISDNKLYLNESNLKFRDITQIAGVSSPDSWCTGATMIDINKDGWLDIYVCRSYHDEPLKRENQLFINNKDLTFSEQGTLYKLNDSGYSIMASFFDYDKDGNPDLYLGNHPKDRYKSNLEHYESWLNPPIQSSNQLYRNQANNTFKNVTTEAGLTSYGWTLGMVTVDLNQDDWTDIYVSVDHTEPDRLYINNKDGTFSETSQYSLKHMSHSSMGVDAADVNNDGLTDLATVEMQAADNYRAKTQMANMNVNQFWDFVIKGYNYQYMRNMLQINNGNGTFREVGQLSNIHKTDWSWACLFFDLDNDGWKDFYVTNGYYKDYMDQDYRRGYNEKIKLVNQGSNQKEKYQLLSQHAHDASSTKLKNYIFKNNADFTFTNISDQSGLDHQGFSNGAAYADLDNDGDLDLVVNNINEKASLFSNNNSESEQAKNWLQVKLIPKPGVLNLGTKIWIETENGLQFHEHTLTRGYQSSVEDRIHFGLGETKNVNSLKIQWPNGNIQEVYNLAPNKLYEIEYKKGIAQKGSKPAKPKLFEEVTKAVNVNHVHLETYFNDYEKQVLLPHQMSCHGPAVALADINNDGLDDFFIGGSQYKSASLFIQDKAGAFVEIKDNAISADKEQEDVGAAFFDADGDGDQDLYVASGGNEQSAGHNYYTDRLYLNDGEGNFQKTTNRIPKIKTSNNCVKPFDYDKDGDLDLFIGARHIPGKYPFAPSSHLLENKAGYFEEVSESIAPALKDLGMVTDALWTDFNNDGTADLFVIGEWMPLTILIQKDGRFENQTAQYNLEETRGWWNCINESDVDQDGDMDYILGNLGLNYKYKTSEDKPFQVYASDFDQNGSNDIILGYFNNDILYPVRGRECSSEQLPTIAQKFPTYDAFAKASLKDIYGDQLDQALHFSANTFQSGILLNDGEQSFHLENLPVEAQSSPVNSIISKDFDNDGIKDLLMAGNLYVAEVETGRADAGIGIFLKGLGNGKFTPQFADQSGFFATGDVKHLKLVQSATASQYILVAKNNNQLQLVKVNDDR